MAVSWQNLLDEAAASGGGSFEPLPIGDYTVVVNESSHTTTQKGKLMFKLQMKVQGGPHDGRFVWSNFVVSPESPKALEIFFQQMATLGLDTSFFAGNPSEDTIAQALLGKRCNVTLQHREWNGQVRNEVKSIKPAIGGSPVAAAPAPAPAAAPAATVAAPAAPF